MPRDQAPPSLVMFTSSCKPLQGLFLPRLRRCRLPGPLCCREPCEMQSASTCTEYGFPLGPRPGRNATDAHSVLIALDCKDTRHSVLRLESYVHEASRCLLHDSLVIDPFEIGFPPTRLDLDKDVLATGKPLTSCPGSYPGNKIVRSSIILCGSPRLNALPRKRPTSNVDGIPPFSIPPHLTCGASTD